MHKNCPVIVAAVGFFFLILGLACSWYIFPKLVEHIIKEVKSKIIEKFQICVFVFNIFRELL